MRFLLDTSIVSETMRPSPNRRILQRLVLHQGHFGICAPTWQELAFGVRRLPDGARRTALHTLLVELREALPPLLPFTGDAADWLATEMARLERRGHEVECEDGQIAAIAHVNDLTLVTANTKHFSRFRGLRLADWRR
jgi:tRNA(fMet)-specific endonuclease VapC